MEKKVLSEIALYHGDVKRPKGYEINRHEIKANILQAQLERKTVTDSEYSYRFFDYKLNFSKSISYVHEHMREYFLLQYKRHLAPVLSFGNILQHREQSFSRKCLDETCSKNEPDFVMIYGVEVAQDSSNVVIEYDDNRSKDKTWHVPLNNNGFVMFPTTQRFFITANIAHQPNFFLLTTFELI